MCLFGGGSSAPAAAPIAPEPTRASVTATGFETPTAIATTKNKISRRLGVFGNFSSSPMGDVGYGKSTGKATFGSVGAAA